MTDPHQHSPGRLHSRALNDYCTLLSGTGIASLSRMGFAVPQDFIETFAHASIVVNRPDAPTTGPDRILSDFMHEAAECWPAWAELDALGDGAEIRDAVASFNARSGDLRPDPASLVDLDLDPAALADAFLAAAERDFSDYRRPDPDDPDRRQIRVNRHFLHSLTQGAFRSLRCNPAYVRHYAPALVDALRDELHCMKRRAGDC